MRRILKAAAVLAAVLCVGAPNIDAQNVEHVVPVYGYFAGDKDRFWESAVLLVNPTAETTTYEVNSLYPIASTLCELCSDTKGEIRPFSTVLILRPTLGDRMLDLGAFVLETGPETIVSVHVISGGRSQPHGRSHVPTLLSPLAPGEYLVGNNYVYLRDRSNLFLSNPNEFPITVEYYWSDLPEMHSETVEPESSKLIPIVRSFEGRSSPDRRFGIPLYLRSDFEFIAVVSAVSESGASLNQIPVLLENP